MKAAPRSVHEGFLDRYLFVVLFPGMDHIYTFGIMFAAFHDNRIVLLPAEMRSAV